MLRYTMKGNMFFFAAFAVGYGANEYLQNEAAKKPPLTRDPDSLEEARRRKETRVAVDTNSSAWLAAIYRLEIEKPKYVVLSFQY